LRAGLLSEELSEEDRHAALSMLLRKTKILLKGARKHNNIEVIEKFEPILNHWLNQSPCHETAIKRDE
ncbi:hypothetical protein ACFL2V_17870, partial [Pseudomonadota bacterium]